MQDILKIPYFSFSKVALPRKRIRFFDGLMMFVSSKIALPLETSSKCRRLFPSKSIKIALPCGAFGKFRSFMNDDFRGFYTNPIPNERRSRWLSWLKREVFGGDFRYRIGIGFVGIGDVLIIFVSSKIALPLETSSKFRRFYLHQNRLKWRSRAEHSENFDHL